MNDSKGASAYTLAALTGELEKVLAAAPGQRNDTLNRAAFALGQLVGAQLLGQHIARDELVSAAGRIGLPRNEAERTITSGLTAGEPDFTRRHADQPGYLPVARHPDGTITGWGAATWSQRPRMQAGARLSYSPTNWS